MTTLASLDPVGTIGRYDLLGRLASGGMAEIFLAREAGPAQSVGRLVVVKRILPHAAGDERMVEMFVHEARLSMNLSHPHICPIYEFGSAEGSFFLAMEWVRGISLRELMERVGPLPIPFVAKVFGDIATALHHAHTCTDGAGHPLSIVHRDVNPENIMVGFDGVAKLLDFGVAKAANQQHQTEFGSLKGKFAYISPEQYQGLALDGRSDLFSLGVSLYEALTGHSLYERASEYETVAAIVLDPAVPSVRESRPDVPEELDAIVLRALAKDRDERYRSADALAVALTRFVGRLGGGQRHADVARVLRELVPDRVSAEPELDRRPPNRATTAPPPAKPRERTSSEEMRALVLAAEAADETDELLGARRRSGRWLGFLSAFVILVSLAIIGWVVLRPRLDADTPPASGAPLDPR